MSQARLVFENPWWFGAAALAAAAVVALLYLWQRGQRRRRPWAAGFGLLRLLALAVLAFVFAGPATQRTTERFVQAELLVYVDVSGSMEREDEAEGAPRHKAAVAALESALEAGPDRDRFGFSVFAFDETVGRIEELGLRGRGTSLAAPLEHALRIQSPDAPTQALIISDGGHNQGADPVARAMGAAELDIRVHTALAGSDAPLRNIAVSNLSAPEIITRDRETEITAVISKTGYGELEVPVDVEFEGRRIGGRTVRLDEERSSVEVTLSVVIPDIGVGRLSVEVRAPEDEELEFDNRQWKRVQVVKDRFTALVIEGRPGWESGFMFRVLDSLDFMDAAYLIRVGAAGRQVRRGRGRLITEFPAQALDYDLIVLGDVESAGLGREELDRIALHLKRGRALITLAGPGTVAAGAAAGTELEQLMALEFGGGPPLERGYELRLTPAGAVHPVCRVSDADDLALLWETLPILYAIYPAEVPAGRGAEALLVDSRDRLPVLAARQSGCIKVLNLAAEGAWRWRMAAAAVPMHREVYVNFWRAAFRWAVTCEQLGAVNLGLSTDHPRLGREIEVKASVVNQAFEPETADRVVLTMTDGRGEPVHETAMLELGPGEYGLRLAPDSPGEFTLTARAFREGEELGADSRPVNVRAPRLEFERVAAAPELLRAVSEKTGGVHGGLEAVAAALEQAAGAGASVVESAKIPLGANPWLIGLAVLLLGVEWFLRRRHGLG